MVRFLSFLLITILYVSGKSPALADDLLSFDLVQESPGSVELRTPLSFFSPLREGDRLELASSSGEEVGVTLRQSAVTSLGNKVIRGETDAGGTAFFIISPAGEILGSVQELGRKFRVNINDEGAPNILPERTPMGRQQIDGSPHSPSIPMMDFGIEAGDKPMRSTYSQALKNSDVVYPAYKSGSADVAVLVYYDTQLANAMSVIDYLMEYSNQALSSSGIDVRLSLAGVVSVALGSDFNKALSEKMDESLPPFSNIVDDRRYYEADIALTVKRGLDPNDNYCGYAPYIGAYKSRPSRDSFVAVASWQPDTTYDYCPDSTFAHELGHLLGGMHLKSDYSSPIVGAFSYSHGHSVSGVFSTIMTSYYSGSRTIQEFSSPDNSCYGYRCGVQGQADIVKTFNATGHMIAGFQGDDFAHELVNAHRVDEQDFECEREGLSGYWEAHGTNNQSKYQLELASQHFVRADGSESVVGYERGERLISPNRIGWYGWCVTSQSPSRLKTEFVESFVRYYNPVTGELTQSESLRWEQGYAGDYSSARIALGTGGSVSGNTVRSVRNGDAETFSIIPDDGYVLESVESNCQGTLVGSLFTVDVAQDDCVVSASFSAVAPSETLRLSIENPAAGLAYSGIGTFQGWAVAQEGIDRVDLYVDGAFFQSAPYGGSRGDVGNIFPDVPNSKNSGFALAYNFGDLSDGTHILKAIAVTENGRTLESSVQFSVAKFHKPFIGAGDSVSLGGAYCSVTDSSISVQDAMIDGRPYDVYLEWRTATQGFEIYRIR